MEGSLLRTLRHVFVALCCAEHSRSRCTRSPTPNVSSPGRPIYSQNNFGAGDRSRFPVQAELRSSNATFLLVRPVVKSQRVCRVAPFTSGACGLPKQNVSMGRSRHPVAFQNFIPHLVVPSPELLQLSIGKSSKAYCRSFQKIGLWCFQTEMTRMQEYWAPSPTPLFQ